MRITFNSGNLEEKLGFFEKQIAGTTPRALDKVADELLRLSQKEVPHDKGLLQNSGMVEKIDDTTRAVGYNKEYAAYQHEGVRADGSRKIKAYGKGRKGKYLEDPLKENLNTFNTILGGTLATEVRV